MLARPSLVSAMRGFLCVALVAVSMPAAADGPTSSALSIVGARTLPSDSTVVSGEAGWPGTYAALHLAPSSVFNLAVRGGVAYGSPFLSLANGIGGQLEVGARLHLYGHDNIDVAASLALGGAVGEGALFGEIGTFANDLGYGVYVDPGVLASFAVSRTLTLTGGVVGSLAYMTVPDRNVDPSHKLGSVALKLAVETLLSRDLLFFAQLTAGAGLKQDRQFDNNALLRLSLGAAFLL